MQSKDWGFRCSLCNRVLWAESELILQRLISHHDLNYHVTLANTNETTEERRARQIEVHSNIPGLRTQEDKNGVLHIWLKEDGIPKGADFSTTTPDPEPVQPRHTKYPFDSQGCISTIAIDGPLKDRVLKSDQDTIKISTPESPYDFSTPITETPQPQQHTTYMYELRFLHYDALPQTSTGGPDYAKMSPDTAELIAILYNNTNTAYNFHNHVYYYWALKD